MYHYAQLNGSQRLRGRDPNSRPLSGLNLSRWRPSTSVLGKTWNGSACEMPRVTIPTLGQYGLVMDQAAQEIPDNAFSSIANVRFRDGMAESLRACRCSPNVTRTGSRLYGTR